MHHPARNLSHAKQMIQYAMMKPIKLNHARRRMLEMITTLEELIEVMAGRPTQHKIEMFLTNQPYDDYVEEYKVIQKDFGKKRRSRNSMKTRGMTRSKSQKKRKSRSRKIKKI